MRKIYYVLFFIVFECLQYFDMWLTNIGLQKEGRYELNILYFADSFIYLKFLAPIAITMCFYSIKITHDGIYDYVVKFGMHIIIGFYIFVVLNNVFMIII